LLIENFMDDIYRIYVEKWLWLSSKEKF
jgi:hypothetical protein